MFEYAGAAGRTRLQRYWGALKEYPSGVLLAAQIIGILVFPFTDEGDVGRTVVSIFGLFVLAVAVLAVNRTPSTRIIAYSLGAPVVVLTIAEAFWSDIAWLEFVSNSAHAIFYFYTAISLLRYMFADAWVSRDELLATGATFTVLVWAFAYTYGAVQVILPDSFTVGGEVRPLSWFELLFLSTTTLTGTGLSDIAPNTSTLSDTEGVNFARSIVMLQMLTGMNYVALVIARLLGLTLIKFRR
ncbi:MAG: ion channel [Ornithinimicrobium sp.]